MDAAAKSVELYEDAAPVVEQAAMDAAAKSVELYEDAAQLLRMQRWMLQRRA